MGTLWLPTRACSIRSFLTARKEMTKLQCDFYRENRLQSSSLQLVRRDVWYTHHARMAQRRATTQRPARKENAPVRSARSSASAIAARCAWTGHGHPNLEGPKGPSICPRLTAAHIFAAPDLSPAGPFRSPSRCARRRRARLRSENPADGQAWEPPPPSSIVARSWFLPDAR